jgi:hypothetical protein
VTRSVSPQEFREILDRWVGLDVTVRVVTGADDLLAVFGGRLGPRSEEKHPAVFWALEVPEQPGHAERPGIYLHPERFEEAVLHEGGFVLELRQGGVTLNLRRR